MACRKRSTAAYSRRGANPEAAPRPSEALAKWPSKVVARRVLARRVLEGRFRGGPFRMLETRPTPPVPLALISINDTELFACQRSPLAPWWEGRQVFESLEVWL
jgi:hypothetical protein